MPKSSWFKEHWTARRESNRQSQSNGEVVISVVGGRLHVSAPYNDSFRLACVELSGTWRARSGVWTFRLAARNRVREAAVACYGQSAIREVV